MAARQDLSVCSSGEILLYEADSQARGCSKCTYLEERIHEMLCELNLMKSLPVSLINCKEYCQKFYALHYEVNAFHSY